MTPPPRTVVCAALNFSAPLDAHADAFIRDPYKHPPRAPVLYFKPPNTYLDPGQAIPCPAGVERLRMGGTLGIVISHKACRVHTKDAASFIAGYRIVNDVSIPHASYFRPAIKERCRRHIAQCNTGAATR